MTVVFSESVLITEKEMLEVAASRLGVKPTWRRVLLQLFVFSAVGAVCLLSPYTMLIGVLLICTGILFSLLGHYIPVLLERGAYLPQIEKIRTTYTITDDFLISENEETYVRVNWTAGVRANFGEKWLLISVPTRELFWFKIESLKQQGAFDKVLELCRRYDRAERARS